MSFVGSLSRQYRLFRRFRRRRAAAGRERYTWEDILGDYSDVSNARYMSFSEVDRWRAVPFDMPPSPARDEVMQHVRRLVAGLDGALDEGTAGALDLYLEALIGRWIATVENEHADHCRMIDLFRCQAAEWTRETAVKLEHAHVRLDQIRSDYLAVAAKLRRANLAEPDGGHEPQEAADSEDETGETTDDHEDDD
jgi:hypothetical protein